jgi:hypothetical protein
MPVGGSAIGQPHCVRLQREDQHQHEREPERRHRVEEQRYHARCAVEDRVLPHRLQHADDHADNEDQHQRGTRQHQRVRQRLEHNRPPRAGSAQGVAEVARKKDVSQRKYWMCSGWSRPRLRRSCSMTSGGTFGLK